MTQPQGHRLFFVTGIPGTGVHASLEKYVKWRVASGHIAEPLRPRILKLEDEICRLAVDDVEKCLDQRTDGSQAQLFQVLQLPKPVLYRLWSAAFRSCIDAADGCIEAGSDVFLTFHACWYHLGNREYISAVDFRALLESRIQPAYVLTVIDDSYDVRSRLSERRGVFQDRFSDESEIVDVVLKLLLILDWRASEIVLSERIAAVTASDHIILAAKHPLKTLDALLYSNRKRIYISHHITEPRRMLKRSAAEQEEAHELIRSIQSLARKLRDSTVLFEPTTIDEARFIDKRRVTGKSRLVPQLSERWPLAESVDELLFVPPTDPLPEFGAEWHARMASGQDALDAVESWDLDGVSALIKLLADLVLNQIDSRDHFLVEHTDGLAVYRPYMLGHEAGGVKEELDHHLRLLQTGASRALAIVLHPPADERMRPRRRAQECAREWARTGKILGPQEKLDQAILSLPRSEALWLALESTDRKNWGGIIRAHFEGQGLTWQVASAASALDASPAIVHKRRDEKLGDELWDYMTKNYLDNFKGVPKTTVLREDLTPETYATRIKKQLEQD